MNWLWGTLASPHGVGATNEDADNAVPLHVRMRDACRRDDADVLWALLRSGRVGVDAAVSGEPPLLVMAARGGHAHVVEMLLTKAHANPNVVDATGQTPLRAALHVRNDELVQVLLLHGADPNAANENGETPLFNAKMPSQVKLLLAAGAKVDAVDKGGRTPLHALTKQQWSEASAEMLLQAGASCHAIDHMGNTPLHFASANRNLTAMGMFLKAGVDPNVRNKSGKSPLSLILRDLSRKLEIELEGAHLLVSHGAEWDRECDGSFEEERDRPDAQSLRPCVLNWIAQRKRGRPLRDIPLEVLKYGKSVTRQFIDALEANPCENVWRRKICVVGPSEWGKTSLIKSITSLTPSLEHTDDRTIGIDLFKWEFVQEFPFGGELRKKHEVTFWDFAGQDEYQAAHSLFFSKRTLYMVCVNLHAYAIALAQARFRAEDDDELDRLMDAFVETKILRWIKLVFGRQPEAEFVLVGTKADAIKHDATQISKARQDLDTRLNEYVTTYRRDIEHEREARLLQRAKKSLDNEPVQRRESSEVARLDELVKNARGMAPTVWITVSCKKKCSVEQAKSRMESVVVNSKRSFNMPETYTRALDLILRKRQEISRAKTKIRVDKTFAKVQGFCRELVDVIPSLDLAQSRGILHLLHDLGDILLYETHGAEFLRDTAILDPLLLIDFVRQVITHDHNGEKMAHKTLMKLPFWIHVDHQLTLALKQVLHHFHLAYPSNGLMQWDSDLLVPAYWRTNIDAYRQIAGFGLHLNDRSKEAGAFSVRWEYHFKSEMPDALFDQWVVASHSPFDRRTVGSDGFRYEEADEIACRMLVDRVCGFSVVRLEALATENAGWAVFEDAWEALELVLDEYPGLLVCKYVVEDETSSHRLEEVLTHWEKRRIQKTWLPPDMNKYTHVMARHRQQHCEAP